jgi:uncharacterized membrane protein YgcG
MFHMRRFGLALLLTFSLIILPTASAQYPAEPEGDWYLLDLGGVLSDGEEEAMNQRLVELTNSTGTLVRVVTISSMQDYTGYDDYPEYFDEDEGYARGMYQHFNMEGGENKTILIALSVEDRRFKFVMPDHSTFAQAQSQKVFDNDVAPELRFSHWNDGLMAAIDGIEPYASDDFTMLPKFVFWGALGMAVLSVPLVILKTKKDFKSANYDGTKTLEAYTRLLKESLVLRSTATFEAMDGEDDSKAKWEHLEDLKSVQECDSVEKMMIDPKIMTAMVRMGKRADDLNISEDQPVEYDGLEEDIASVNNHIVAKSYFFFGAYVFSSFFFIIMMLLFNLGLKSIGLGFDVIFIDFNTFDGLYMILLPLLFTVIHILVITFLKPLRITLSTIVSIFISRQYMENSMLMRVGTEPLSSTPNPAGGFLIPGFLGATGMMSMNGFLVVSSGRDEFGNEMYDVQRDYSSSDSGGDSGGGCGGGGCGGGGCGGGGGF